MMQDQNRLSVKSPRLKQIARQFLVEKGCVILPTEDGYEQITFPAGTQKAGQRGERGQFIESAGEFQFPDGTLIEELVDAHLSYLQLPGDVFGIKAEDVTKY